MLRSMTAFGRSSTSSKTDEFVCELRSVNHRYLDVSVRLPDSLRSQEGVIRERLSARLQRGKVEVTLRQNETTRDAASLIINEPLLKELSAAVDKVSAMTGAAQSADPLRLLQWPGVLMADSGSHEEMAASALSAFDQALEDFVATREREGAHTSVLLVDKAHAIAELILGVRVARPQVVARQREKLLAKLETLDAEFDSARLEQELVYAAQRLDIDEELDRLDAHVIELQKVVQRNEAVGRRLDFLMQEFNREANTLSSKSNDSQTTAAGVDMKVLIEQMREQVQNIE